MRRALATAGLDQTRRRRGHHRAGAGRCAAGGGGGGQSVFGGLGRAVLRGEPSGRSPGRRRLRARSAAGERWRCWCLAATPTYCMSGRSVSRSSSWAAPSTTRRGRPTTRWPGCWGWAIPAARCSTIWRRPVTGTRSCFPRHTGPRDDPNAFSFSGLKTAVARYVESHPDAATVDIAAGFQESVADVLTMKAVRAAPSWGCPPCSSRVGWRRTRGCASWPPQRCEAARLTLRIPGCDCAPTTGR